MSGHCENRPPHALDLKASGGCPYRKLDLGKNGKVRAIPSPARDAFAIGDSNPSTKRGRDEASSHGTRSNGPGTPAEWNQSLARYRLAARGSAAWIGLRGCPCLTPVLGSPCRKWRRGRAAGSAGTGRRERPPAVAAPSIPRSGGRSH